MSMSNESPSFTDSGASVIRATGGLSSSTTRSCSTVPMTASSHLAVRSWAASEK